MNMIVADTRPIAAATDPPESATSSPLEASSATMRMEKPTHKTDTFSNSVDSKLESSSKTTKAKKKKKKKKKSKKTSTSRQQKEEQPVIDDNEEDDGSSSSDSGGANDSDDSDTDNEDPTGVVDEGIPWGGAAASNSNMSNHSNHSNHDEDEASFSARRFSSTTTPVSSSATNNTTNGNPPKTATTTTTTTAPKSALKARRFSTGVAGSRNSHLTNNHSNTGNNNTNTKTVMIKEDEPLVMGTGVPLSVDAFLHSSQGLHDTTISFDQLGGDDDDDHSISLRTATARSVNSHPSSLSSTTTGHQTRLVKMVETHMAVRVMKGEIHNVLAVMRSSDQFLYVSAHRFVDELSQTDHPIVGQFQELHSCLSEWDLTMAAQQLYKRKHKQQKQQQLQQRQQEQFDLSQRHNSINTTTLMGFDNHDQTHNMASATTTNDTLQIPHTLLYLPPFCTAISTREINAPVTGACLTALHKFLLYGLVHPAKDAKAGMTLIAQALLNCTFEETSVSKSLSGAVPPLTRAQKRATLQHAKQQQSSQQQSSSQLPPRSASLAHSAHDASSSSAARRASSIGGGSHHAAHATYYQPARVDDEQVVLKLLDLAAMVVQCSFLSSNSNGDCLIDADLVVGLLDTCLHVSHIAKSASPLLKSAATDALARIVLQVFCHAPNANSNGGESSQDFLRRSTLGSTMNMGAPSPKNHQNLPRPQVLAKLASLLNPANHDEQVIVSSLTAVNIALETSGGTSNENPLTDPEVHILQNDLCKYLLQWSTTSDLHILSLTLRVIFNLFQSIPNQLKVPLEVFLTSVHLRILNGGNTAVLLSAKPNENGHGKELDPSSSSSSHHSNNKTLVAHNNEEKEVVLESILEFCQEPALMQDIYRNYDCDVACTNLYESIVEALGRQACPNDMDLPSHLMPASPAAHVEPPASPAWNRPGEAALGAQAPTTTTSTTTSTGFFTVHTTPAPITQLNKLAMEGLLAIINSIARRVHADRSPLLRDSSVSMNASTPIAAGMSFGAGGISFAVDESSNMSGGGMSDVASEEELHQRRQRKAALAQVAELFNEDFMGVSWIDMAVNLDVLDSTENAKGVAEVLYSAAGLDKAKVGIYLSKGPDEQYPFHAKVRQEFVSLYDFTEMNFAASLRLFLSKFRLPGEAQCIDRFMEAFSTELYQQQGGEMSQFKDSDALYVLAFSTIMLNTDLHNPTIKEQNRMTKEQFIKNNRGINGGEDLASEYLSELYDQIKEKQIQVQREVGEFMKKQEEDEDFRSAWDSILAKHREVATAFFTSAGDARRNIYRAGMHDREMFTLLSRWAMVILPAVFKKAWDDALVFKTLRGLKQMVLIADHFEMKHVVNEIIQLLLTKGRDYVFRCITEDHTNAIERTMRNQRQTSNRSLETSEEDPDETTYAESEEKDNIIPYCLLSSGKNYTELEYHGAALHRGLLALDTGFLLVRRYARKVVGAWPIFIECLCAMRDAKALPAGLSDLDDFADSNGNVLPLSRYADISQKRLDNFYATESGEKKKDRRAFFATSAGLEAESGKAETGWFAKLFSSKSALKPPEEAYETDDLDKNPEDRRSVAGSKHRKQNDLHHSDHASVSSSLAGHSETSRAILGVAESANVEKIVQMGSTKLPVAEQTIRSLLDVVDDFPYDDDPVAEQHAIFSLELAARALLSNRERAVEIFPVFLSKFESVLGKISEDSVPSPFVIERIVVTILRCSIHLYDVEELRPNLRVSLHLLVMSIPRSFLRDIADRMACGLAIILRASFPFFESHNEWAFMGDTLDTLANFGSARVFVFDGIASTVECAMPQQYQDDEDASTDGSSKAGEDPPQLSKEACGALSRILIRYVLGFYQNDFSLSVPASVCLEKVYHQMNSLYLDQQAAAAAAAGKPMELTEKDRKTKIPNKDYWQNVAVAMYSVCRSPDPDVSRHGYEVCQRIILRTSMREIPADKWLAILYLMVNKQPPTAADLSRSNTFVLLGNMLMRVLPYLSKKQRPIDADEESKEGDDMIDGEDLSDLIRQTAMLAGENLRHGRRGRVSALFEKTLQTVTYLSNHMQTDEWKGDRGFGLWASESLLAELEKVGAAGNSLQNQEAIKEKQDVIEEEDEEEDDEEGEEGEEKEKEETEGDEQDDDPTESA